MNQLIKYRLIGGGVLIATAAVFLPQLLNPNPIALEPTSISISKPSEHQQSNNTVTTTYARPLSDKIANRPNQQPEKPLVLESILEDPLATRAPNATPTKSHNKNLTRQTEQTSPGKQRQTKTVTIALESMADIATNQVPPAPTSVKSTNKIESPTAAKAHSSWIMIGSFTNLANAEAAASKLKHNHYPVEIENTALAGKVYHRVLVGPYGDKKSLQMAKKSLETIHYQPVIQR